MNEVIKSTFDRTLALLESEFAMMPLSRWTESVLRYFFCRVLADTNPEIEQFVECGRIDLVLRQPPVPHCAFIEFKLYGHPRRFDPYDGEHLGFKGGPGSKNLEEFRKCVEALSGRRALPNLSKYIILVYADPTDGARPNLRYSNDYGDYRHSTHDVQVRLLASTGAIKTKDDFVVTAKLFEVSSASSSSPESTARVSHAT
jgi:hypothetical protein